MSGDGDDLIVADPRSSPVWLNAKIGRFLVKVELILICRSTDTVHTDMYQPQITSMYLVLLCMYNN